MFRDPLGLIAFELPPGWIEYPGNSRLDRLTFIPWTDDANLTVELFETLAHAPNDEEGWRAAAAVAIKAPDDAERVLLPAREGMAVYVSHPQEGREIAAAVVRGLRLDVVVRGTGPLGSGALREALESISATAEVPHNRVADIPFPAAIAEHASLVRQATIALPAVGALLARAGQSRDLSTARVAEALARRALNNLRDESEDVWARTGPGAERWLAAACALQRQLMGEDGAPSKALPSAAMAAKRVPHAVLQAKARLDPRAGAAHWEDSVEDALLVVVDRQARGLPAATEVMMASSLAGLLAQYLLFASRIERATGAAELAVATARTAGEGPDVRRTLAQALLTLATMLLDIGAPDSLKRAAADTEEADALVAELPGAHALVAWTCSLRAAISMHRGVTDGVRALVDRGLAAANAQPDLARAPELVLRQVDALLRAKAGDAAGAVEAMRRAQGVELPVEPDAVGQLRQALQLVRLAQLEPAPDDPDAGLRSAVAGLTQILRIDPFSTEAAHAFRTAAEEVATPTLAEYALRCAAGGAAVAALDVRRAWLAEDAFRIDVGEAELADYVREQLIGDYADAGMMPMALEEADRGRGRALLTLLATPILDSVARPALPDRPPVDLGDGSPAEQLVRAVDWMADVANSALYALNESAPVAAAEIERLAADAGEVLLVLQPVDTRLLLLAVTSDGQTHGRWSPTPWDEVLATAAEVAKGFRVNAVTRDVGESPPGRVDAGASLGVLWSSILAPVADLLPANTPLVVTPFREAWLFPFSLLTSPDGRRLGDDHPLSLAPSPTTLVRLRDRGAWERPRPRSAYVAADPKLGGKYLGMGLAPLPFAGREGDAVDTALAARGVPAADRVVLHGPAATEASYRERAAGCDLVHLACHARLRDPAPTSCLYLAASGPYDGLLTAVEIGSVELEDALVVLTACDSGQGRPTADSLVGLGRAFLEAGARAVVLSLWKVPDAVGAAFSRHLYDALFAGDDLAHAVHAATGRTRDQLSAGAIADAAGAILDDRPAHWAPFVVVGDAGSVRFTA